MSLSYILDFLLKFEKLKYLSFNNFQSTVNIIFDRVGKVDPVTRGIEIAVNYLGIQFDVSLYFFYIENSFTVSVK